MPRILNRQIDRVLVVDDDPGERSGHTWVLEDAEFEPVPEEGPLEATPDRFAKRVAGEETRVQAALCDQRLGVRAGYAAFLGAEIVKHWYSHKFPAVLCTRYEDAAINDIRPMRRWIPALLSYDELHGDVASFERACRECIYEFDVGFRPHREPWRAQVVVVDVDEPGRHIWLEVPSWEQSARIHFRAADLPRDVASVVEPGLRLFAEVNLGAERNEDLYFDNWELPR